MKLIPGEAPEARIQFLAAGVNLLSDQLTAERHARHEAALRIANLAAMLAEIGMEHVAATAADIARDLEAGRVVVLEGRAA